MREVTKKVFLWIENYASYIILRPCLIVLINKSNERPDERIDEQEAARTCCPLHRQYEISKSLIVKTLSTEES